MIKIHYYIECLDAICLETFRTIEEMKEWIAKGEDFDEIMDINIFDKDGYFVMDIPVEDYVKTL